jgi:hypothetical protein
VREQGLSVENELSYLREFDHITLARVLLARYQSDRASSIAEVMGLLERLLKAAEAGGRMGSVIEILVLQALLITRKVTSLLLSCLCSMLLRWPSRRAMFASLWMKAKRCDYCLKTNRAIETIH